MTRRAVSTRAVGVAIAAAWLVGACGGDDTATTAAEGSAESLCAAYREAGPALFIVAFASLADDPDSEVTVTGDGPGSVDDVYVLLSPPLAELYGEFAAYAENEGLEDEAAAAREVADVFAEGVEALRDAGLDEDQLEVLADVASWPDDDSFEELLPPTLTEGVGPGEPIFEGSSDLAARIDALQTGEADEGSPLDDEDFDAASDVVDPEQICADLNVDALDDPCLLVSQATIVAVLDDDTPTSESESEPILGAVNCLWEGENESAVSVSLYPASQYEIFDDVLGPEETEFSEAVDDVGETAFLSTGFSTLTSGRGSFAARTIYVLDGDATLVIGFDSAEAVNVVDQAEIDDAVAAADESVLALADEVLAARGP